jgi:hypothetical protein
MARSKSKSRSNQNANAKSTQGQALPAEGCDNQSTITRQIGAANLGTSMKQVDSADPESITTCEAAVGLLEQVSDQTESREESSELTPNASVEVPTTKTGFDDLDFQIKHQEIEAALERVDRWLTDNSTECKIPELSGHSVTEDAANGKISQQEINVVSPDHCPQSGRGARKSSTQETLPANSNQLIVFESEQQPQFQQTPGAQGLEQESACQRLEATAAKIESRLEQLWNGFAANLDTRINRLLQVLDRMPQRLTETRVDLKVSAREANSSGVPAEATWESRKRQMLSEFGMTPDEIDQHIPNQKQAKAVNEKSNLAANVDSVALEALHTSLETLDKIDSGIRSEEIDRLKEQLTAQLREAEVELSINRAKLCKEWAALEQRATELNQRESVLKSKYSDAKSANKHGLLDRITRHLSRRS